MTSKPPPTVAQSTSSTSKMTQKSKSKSIPTPLSIPPSSVQSLLKPTGANAPPPNNRSLSAPLPSSPAFDPPPNSSQDKLPRSNKEGPKSAGYEGKNVRFGYGKHAEEGDKGTKGGKIDPLKKRYSNENHVNVYTDCGRHGDDWLFGGWSIGGVVRKVWERKE